MDRLGYRPALDGVRGIAIALVVCKHAFGFPHGGFLGVDLFFVLSGFLITTLLLEEHEASGRISLGGFYGRRALRLLPALSLLILAYVIVGGLLGQPLLLPSLGAVFYFTNVVDAWEWKATALTHLWSLATEEQFYLLWPPLLLIVLRWPRIAARLLIGLLVVLVAHRVWLTMAGASGIRLDYAPDTRADGIIVGCLFAVWRRETDRQKFLSGCKRLLAWSGPLVFILILGLRPGEPLFHLALPLIAFAFAALVALAATPGSVTPLEWKPLAQLGRISYSLYLWHLPILMLLIGFNLGFDPVRSTAAVAASVAVATVSTLFVEEPLRRRGRSKRQRVRAVEREAVLTY